MQYRDTYFRIPVVPVGNMVLVTDRTVCSKASKALAEQVQNPTPGPVYVVKIFTDADTWYVVHSPKPPASGGEFRNYLILDQRFNRYGGWSG